MVIFPPPQIRDVILRHMDDHENLKIVIGVTSSNNDSFKDLVGTHIKKLVHHDVTLCENTALFRDTFEAPNYKYQCGNENELSEFLQAVKLRGEHSSSLGGLPRFLELNKNYISDSNFLLAVEILPIPRLENYCTSVERAISVLPIPSGYMVIPDDLVERYSDLRDEMIVSGKHAAFKAYGLTPPHMKTIDFTKKAVYANIANIRHLPDALKNDSFIEKLLVGVYDVNTEYNIRQTWANVNRNGYSMFN